MKIVVLTTSYPRYEGDPAGNFVADAVEQLRARGLEVDVVSPASFRHFGIAYGSGVMGNLKRSPWKAALLPAMLGSFARAARRAASDADLVHAHWLPSGAVALATGKPFVVQLWGTDVELARRMRGLARRVLSRARLTICASNALADTARELGAREVRVIPSAVELPVRVAEPAEPPEVLFVGRLSAEKGILELVQAADGMKLTVAGDGPLRGRVPGALGQQHRLNVALGVGSQDLQHRLVALGAREVAQIARARPELVGVHRDPGHGHAAAAEAAREREPGPQQAEHDCGPLSGQVRPRRPGSSGR